MGNEFHDACDHPQRDGRREFDHPDGEATKNSDHRHADYLPKEPEAKRVDNGLDRLSCAWSRFRREQFDHALAVQARLSRHIDSQ
ncbi:MAG: hypothetical protein FD148_524 [Methylocystaceae bacterium]|nr:MAG: hypothetical protein FD148_524 [Methylocystaceae bacterium]